MQLGPRPWDGRRRRSADKYLILRLMMDAADNRPYLLGWLASLSPQALVSVFLSQVPLQWHFDLLEHFLDHIVDGHAVQHFSHGLQRAAPLHATVVFGCCQ